MHRRHEAVPIRKRGARPPEFEPQCVAEIVGLGGARCRDIKDPRAGKRYLNPDAGQALFRPSCSPEVGLCARRVGHGMCFVENHKSVEVMLEPVKNLLEAEMPS